MSNLDLESWRSSFCVSLAFLRSLYRSNRVFFLQIECFVVVTMWAELPKTQIVALHQVHRVILLNEGNSTQLHNPACVERLCYILSIAIVMILQVRLPRQGLVEPYADFIIDVCGVGLDDGCGTYLRSVLGLWGICV